MAIATVTVLPEIWMQLKDRKQLAKLMTIQGVSARQLATQAGWRSHSYMNRLLNGQATTLEVEPAVRIAKYLGVGTDDLFVTRASTDQRQSGKRRSAA